MRQSAQTGSRKLRRISNRFGVVERGVGETEASERTGGLAEDARKNNSSKPKKPYLSLFRCKGTRLLLEARHLGAQSAPSY